MKKDELGRWKLELRNGEDYLYAVLEDKAREGWEIHPRIEFVESKNIAFDHGKVIAYSIIALRQWITTTKIALHLLPENYTQAELKQVYEAVLETTLQDDAFCKEMEG